MSKIKTSAIVLFSSLRKKLQVVATQKLHRIAMVDLSFFLSSFRKEIILKTSFAWYFSTFVTVLFTFNYFILAPLFYRKDSEFLHLWHSVLFYRKFYLLRDEAHRIEKVNRKNRKIVELIGYFTHLIRCFVSRDREKETIFHPLCSFKSQFSVSIP